MKILKWYFICMGVIFSMMYAGLAYQSYTRSQCRIAGITAHETSSEIHKICGDD